MILKCEKRIFNDKYLFINITNLSFDLFNAHTLLMLNIMTQIIRCTLNWAKMNRVLVSAKNIYSICHSELFGASLS